MKNNFPKHQSGEPIHTLSKLYDVLLVLYSLNLYLRQCLALFAASKGWLFFDFGWFVLLLSWFNKCAFLFKASAHSFKQFTSRLLKSTFSLSLCTYITRMDVMLDFICMGPVDLTGAHRKLQNTKWKISCPQWDSNPQPFDPKSDALPTELAGLGECCLFKWPYYIHVLPIPMFTLLYVPEWWSRA